MTKARRPLTQDERDHIQACREGTAALPKVLEAARKMKAIAAEDGFLAGAPEELQRIIAALADTIEGQTALIANMIKLVDRLAE